jgi:hypothetical protein
MLADMFCSGVPLSTLDFEQNFTYAPSSTTADVYRHALGLLDSAEALSADSADVQTLIQVSRGRALLALGEYESAAKAVAGVPDGASYRMRVVFGPGGGSLQNYVALYNNIKSTVADREGVNGIPYISSGDPRTASDTLTILQAIHLHYPNKYSATDSTYFVLGDGIEARLIQAEAALHAGDVNGWLTILNALRTDGTFTTTPNTNPDAVGVVDTTWHAGSGGMAGLKPLTDPGTLDARVDTMFAERAAWLFFTGHRLGDLRRLSRQYGRNPETVFPTGMYFGGSKTASFYGTAVNAPIPAKERINPNFHGCLNRDP